MSEQPPSPKRMRYNLRSTAAHQRIASSLPVQPQPGCSSDAKVNKPKSEPESAEKNLMILNDDCLLKVFHLLKLADLCQVAFVNKRLNALIKRYIQTKYHVRFEKKFDFIPYNGRINVQVAKAFFQIFGDEIEELKLTRDSFDGTFDDYNSMYQIFSSLEQHCTIVKKFTLHGFGTAGLNCKMFKHLSELTLEKCSVSRDWCEMRKLKILRMSEVIFRQWPSHYSPPNHFDNLIEVRLTDVNFENYNVSTLLEKNPNIKILSVVKCHEISSNFFTSLVHLKKLEEFEFKKQLASYSSVALNELHKMTNLKVLKMSFNDAPATAFFKGFTKNGIAIEHFEFRGGRFNDETVSGIVKMQTLKILKLYEVANVKEPYILRIADELKQLEELHIEICSAHTTKDTLKAILNAPNQLKCLKILASGGFDLDMDTFQAILDTPQTRNKNNTLELTIYGDRKQSLSVPNEKMKGKNGTWLKVTVLDRNTNHLYEDLVSKVEPPPYSDHEYDSDEYDSDYYY